jgi:hypothetical protein
MRSKRAVRACVYTCICVLMVLAWSAAPLHAAAATGVFSPYFSLANSPLVTGSPGFKFEDFEPSSPSLPTLGINLTTVHPSSVDPGLSVDGDDGSIDGSGAAGHSLTVPTQAGTTGATFSFNNIVLGGYPKSAAVAVTAYAGNQLVFTVFDTSNAVSGTFTLTNVSTSTPTADDFLFAASDPAGIGAISVSSNNAFTHLHLDHVQLDTVNAISIPEPGSSALLVTAAVLAVGRRRRHR